jgi:hypothetical protein
MLAERVFVAGNGGIESTGLVVPLGTAGVVVGVSAAGVVFASHRTILTV